ncbi:MAG TPA: protein kinase, partial [Blastocatellia bacterium]|nr:protein kinase [Blastocatellia bacterium]
MKRCPFCTREFKDSLIHCVIDGHKLESDDARPLSDILNTEAPIEIERAARIAIALCDVLEDLHRAGRIIGDLRPQQILIDDGSRSPIVRIIEEKSSAKQKAQPFLAAYLSPEAAQRQEVDKTSDIYSVGTILYEMLTGQLPFKASSPAALIVKQLLERPHSLRDLRPEISDKLQEVVLRAIEKERSARQQSVRQLKQELEDAASSASIRSSLPITGSLEAAPPVASPTLLSAPPAPVAMPASQPMMASAPQSAPSYATTVPKMAAVAPSKASLKKLLPFVLIGLVLAAAVAAVVVLQSNQSKTSTSSRSNTNAQPNTSPIPEVPNKSLPPDPRQTPSVPPPTAIPPRDNSNTGGVTPTGPPPRPTLPDPSNSNTNAPPVTSPAPEEAVSPIIWILLGVGLAGAAVATTLFIMRRKSAAAKNRFQPAQATPAPW